MTLDELTNFLVARKALIVHCSRPGKAGEGINGGSTFLFPDDLKSAIDICANKRSDVSCSVVWPSHVKTFGAVGIILRPRSIDSITSVCFQDAGTSVDPITNRRRGLGVQLSAEAVTATFEKPMDYNEWTVTDAETVGIFVNHTFPGGVQVAKLTKREAIPGYQPGMPVDELVIHAASITPQEIMDQFPNYPLYYYSGNQLARFGVNPNEIYRPSRNI